ncbi:MAG TPA: hypothetical protein VFP33_13070 [Gallionella sp.]|nr:hypothetical protein [Gallionella sp.]
MSTTVKSDELAMFLQMQLDELLEMSDEDILEGESPDTLRSENLAMIANAKAEAGRRRMAAAKAGISERKASVAQVTPLVSVSEARAFIEAAMNDPQFTLAARSLGEMSNEDILRLYSQLHQIKSRNLTSDNGN